MAEAQYGTWLTESCLLLVGDGDLAGEPAPIVTMVSDGRSISLESQHFPYSRSMLDEADDAAGATSVLVVIVPQTNAEPGSHTELAISTGDRTLTVTPDDLRSITEDSQTFLRRAFAPLDAAARGKLLELLASTLESVPRAERTELSDKLFSVREALRERLPAFVVSEARRLGFHVDRLLSIDDRSFYVQGWMHDEEFRIVRLTAVSPEGSRCELLDRTFRYSRPDVARFLFDGELFPQKLGFICFFELDSPSLRGEGWVFEIENERKVALEITGLAAQKDVRDVKDALLDDPFIHGLPNDELMSTHISPAMCRLQSRLGEGIEAESVEQYGTPPESPEISIVVPLYKQIHHLEIQLSQFADDEQLFATDLVYVLDSPEQKDALLTYAADLFPIYQVPFRIAVLERNAGFAGANNAGAALARGRLLLLLNSDVLPDEAGWLGRMRDFHDATPKIGALGPKLLYEDDSIQHAGMYFHQHPGSSMWIDAHYYKGMHRSLPAANVARPVPVVSGACLMIDRRLYRELGGLSGAYVQGDYEDSDLCLQLLGRGLQNWFLPEAELYHLEGQSYSGDARRPSNRYNMWLHSHLWRDQITRIMQGDDSLDNPASAATKNKGR